MVGFSLQYGLCTPYQSTIFLVQGFNFIKVIYNQCPFRDLFLWFVPLDYDDDYEMNNWYRWKWVDDSIYSAVYTGWINYRRGMWIFSLMFILYGYTTRQLSVQEDLLAFTSTLQSV